MAPLVAFLDANVLYPAGLRSFLMYLAVSGVFRARWSRDVHEEWISNLLVDRPDLTWGQLDRTRRLMDKHAPGALVKGYQSLISGLTLPDANDRHVLAAAIRAEASIVVTKNLKDFPSHVLKRYNIEPKHPDAFILRLIDLFPQEVFNAAETHRKSLKNPPKTVEQYLEMLSSQGIPQTAAALQPLLTRD